MSRKIVDCPHCGRILSEKLWKEKDSSSQKLVKCPQCGSRNVWKDGKLYTPQGEVQRYLCRDCGYRFSLR